MHATPKNYPDNHLEPEYLRLKGNAENMMPGSPADMDEYRRRFEKYFAPGLIAPVPHFECEGWLALKIPTISKALGVWIQWRLDPYGHTPWQVEVMSLNPSRSRTAHADNRADATVIAMVEWFEGNIYRAKEEVPQPKT